MGGCKTAGSDRDQFGMTLLAGRQTSNPVTIQIR